MGLNVLVVDDSAVMRSVIVRTLHLSGLPLSEVHEAANGKEALELLDRQWIDLALVDINMPVMNGEELIDRIRESPAIARLPVVVISTESSDTSIERLRKKCSGFVHKPFMPENLRETILGITGELQRAESDESEFGEGALPDSSPDF